MAKRPHLRWSWVAVALAWCFLSASPAGAQDCVPDCRSGYVCVGGQCVSACNPPCPDGQQCTADAECVAIPVAPAGFAPAPPPPGAEQPAGDLVAPEGYSESGVQDEFEDELPPPPSDEPPLTRPPPPPSAGAPSAPPDPRRDAHRGFFLRLTLGGGVVGAGQETSTRSTEIGGGGFFHSLAVGYAVVRNLVVHGVLFGAFLVEPSVEVAELGIKTRTDSSETVSFFGLGAGVTYYIMPINLFVSGALGLGGGNAEKAAGDALDAGGGLAAHLQFGKEWLLSNDWGLGVAVQGFMMSMSGEPDPVGAVGLGAAASVTYN